MNVSRPTKRLQKKTAFFIIFEIGRGSFFIAVVIPVTIAAGTTVEGSDNSDKGRDRYLTGRDFPVRRIRVV